VRGEPTPAFLEELNLHIETLGEFEANADPLPPSRRDYVRQLVEDSSLSAMSQAGVKTGGPVAARILALIVREACERNRG